MLELFSCISWQELWLRLGRYNPILMSQKRVWLICIDSTKHDEVKTMIAHWAKHDLVSVGASLSHVHVPGREVSESTLGSKEIEIGMGIHNEQGSMTVEMPEFPELVKLLLKQLLDERDTDRAFLKKIHEERTFILMVNNLGGVSPLEMCGITAEVVEQLSKSHSYKGRDNLIDIELILLLEKIYSIVPRRVYSGTFMTSLNGNGFSITLYRLPERPAEVLGFLDRETRTSGSPSSMHFGNWFKPEKPAVIDDSAEGSEAMSYVKSGLSSKGPFRFFEAVNLLTVIC